MLFTTQTQKEIEIMKKVQKKSETKLYGLYIGDDFNEWFTAYEEVRSEDKNVLIAIAKKHFSELEWNEETIVKEKEYVEGNDINFEIAIYLVPVVNTVSSLEEYDLLETALDCNRHNRKD